MDNYDNLLSDYLRVKTFLFADFTLCCQQLLRGTRLLVRVITIYHTKIKQETRLSIPWLRGPAEKTSILK